MKKQPGDSVLELERTRDILAELGKRKTHQVLVGFAAETENIQENALRKMERKNTDMIVANNVTQAGAGFGTDTNIVTIYTKDGRSFALPQMSKADIAHKILDAVAGISKTAGV